jgi:diguanylate cyclase
MHAALSAELFSAFFETSDQPSLLLQGEQVVAANAAALRVLRCDASTIQAEALTRWFGPTASLQGLFGEVKRGSSRATMEMHRCDGTTFLGWVRCTRFVADSGEACTSVQFDDVTEHLQLQRQLRESDERYRRLLDAMAEGMVVQDMSGTIISCNAAACQLLGLTEAEVLGRTSKDPRWRTVTELGDDLAGEDHPSMRALRTGVAVRDAVLGLHLPNGALSWLSVNAVPVFNDDGVLVNVVCTFSDITLRKSVEANLVMQAQTDSLTGLSNRRALEARVAELKRQPSERPFSLVQLDIDHFKLVNDTHGHTKGDEVLKAVAEAMRTCLRAEDLPARTGGEEFCVLLPGADTLAASRVAERIRQAVEATEIELVEGTAVRVTVSVGVACCVTADFELREQQDRADQALYRAKQAGRNQVMVAA